MAPVHMLVSSCNPLIHSTCCQNRAVHCRLCKLTVWLPGIAAAESKAGRQLRQAGTQQCCLASLRSEKCCFIAACQAHWQGISMKDPWHFEVLAEIQEQ